MDLLDRLLAHDVWTTLHLLERCRSLSEIQLDQTFDLGHGTVRRTFAHLVYNMEVWTTLMEGHDAQFLDEHETLNALEHAVQRVGIRLGNLARRVQAQRGWDDLWTDTLDHPPALKTFGGGIGHILTHSMHHRAQLIHMLKRLGVTDVPEGDLLSWEHQHRPPL